jgi:hypothetical protein
MEEPELRQRTMNSKFIESPEIQKEIDALKKAVEVGKKDMDYEISHDEEILKAITIVEQFLRKSGRVCYGGQAINAHLPKQLKFYDEEYDIPDYDFFTPAIETDLRELVKMLQKEGFTDIYEKPGIHEGTTKLYVNFVAIADLTQVSRTLYQKLSKDSAIIFGIHYLNEDLLRMNMYLELSRPRGDLSRWEKVFERLMLLNAAKPIQRCGKPYKHRLTKIEPDVRQEILEYIVDEKRVLAGAEIGFIYRTYGQRQPPEMNWILRSGGPVIFFTPELEKDAQAIKSIFEGKNIQIERKKGYKDYIPARIVLRKNRRIIAFLVDEISCNSYNPFFVKNLGTLQIASLDTLIYLYLMLGLLTDDLKQLGGSLLCICQRLIELEDKMRKAPYSRFPLFTISCSGHQKSFISLLREKAKRKETKKVVAKGQLKFTQKVNQKSRSKTRSKTRSRTQKSKSKAD